MANGLIRPLLDGPLDIVGDVHGELQALQALLVRLGYDECGEHPGGRRLVFVGDLCDRSPDRPGGDYARADVGRAGARPGMPGRLSSRVLLAATSTAQHPQPSGGAPDLFGGEPPDAWLQNERGCEVAFRIDFSVGA